jgi:hypothetical protein
MSTSSLPVRPQTRGRRYLAVFLTSFLAISGVIGIAAPAKAATQQATFANDYLGRTDGLNGNGFYLPDEYLAKSLLNNYELGVLSNVKLTFVNGDEVPLAIIYRPNNVSGAIIFQLQNTIDRPANTIWPLTVSADISIDYTIDCNQLTPPNDVDEFYEDFDGSSDLIKTVKILNCSHHYILDGNTNYNPEVNGDGIWAVSIPSSCTNGNIWVGGYTPMRGTDTISWTIYFSNSSDSCFGGGGGSGSDNTGPANVFIAEGFSKGKAKLTKSMRAFIKKEMKTVSNPSRVVCIGTVRGKKWTESRQALALARATSGCNYATKLYPEINIELKKRLISDKRKDSLTVRMRVFQANNGLDEGPP